jgi:diguanylate cyclase (GGDEF)-like protein
MRSMTAQGGPPTSAVLLDGFAIERECIRQAVMSTWLRTVSGMITAALLVASLVGQMSLAVGATWWLAVALVRICIRMIGRAFVRNEDLANPWPRRRYLAIEFAEGLLWGGLPFIAHVKEERYLVLITTSVVAISTVASLAACAIPAIARAFTIPALFLMGIWTFSNGGRWGITSGVGVVLIYVFAAQALKVSSGELRGAIAGRLVNESLARELESARARAEFANTELHTMNEQLHDVARRDPLTGLRNRRHFMELLDELQHADAAYSPWYLVILDVDYFKRINDEFGHQTGDRVLVSLSAAADAEVRASDCLARIGGEEFAVLLRDVDYHGAVRIVERIRAAVHALDVGVGPLTISAGLVAGEPSLHPTVALSRADHALYEAKRSGRDQLICDPPLVH